MLEKDWRPLLDADQPPVLVVPTRFGHWRARCVAEILEGAGGVSPIAFRRRHQRVFGDPGLASLTHSAREA